MYEIPGSVQRIKEGHKFWKLPVEQIPYLFLSKGCIKE